jgi:hypothetical protein
MTSAHVFYIPLVLLAGTVIGFVLGRRLLLAEQQTARQRAERLAQRQPEV